MWVARQIPFLSCLGLGLILCAKGDSPQPQVIQGGTRIVLVDVVVRDKHGKPIEDLSRDDFVLRDEGQEQKIKFFSLEQPSATSPISISTSHLTFTNRPASASALTVLLFD